jgi:hypothetical protein
MRRSRWIAALVLLCVTLPAGAQDFSSASAPPVIIKEFKTPAGTLEQFFEAIQAVDPNFQYSIARSPGTDPTFPTMPATHFKNVSVDQLFACVFDSHPSSIRLGRIEGPVQRIHAVSVWQEKDALTTQVIGLTDVINGLAATLKTNDDRNEAVKTVTKDVLTLLETVLKSAGAEPNILFHEQTQSVIIRATKDQIASANGAIDTLRQRYRDAQKSQMTVIDYYERDAFMKEIANLQEYVKQLRAALEKETLLRDQMQKMMQMRPSPTPTTQPKE